MRTVSLSILVGITAAVALTSCGKNERSGQEIDQAEIADKIKYIRMDDADSILPEWSTENIVVNHTVGEPDNFHPANGVTAARTWILQYTSNFVMRSDIMHMDIAPELATALPEISGNNLNYTYTLRKDARWDDGAPITAEDVVFMLKAHKCPLTANPVVKPYFENIRTVITYPDDPYKFTVSMKREHINNIAFFTDFPVMQRTFHDPSNILASYTFEQMDDPNFKAGSDAKLSAWANNFNDPKYGTDLTMQNGSGPYRIAEWSAGNLILERKKNHWTQKLASPTVYETSLPEKIIFKVVMDPNAQKLEMRAQTLDVSVWLPTPVAKELMQEADFNKNYNIQFTDNFSFNYIGLNMRPDGTMRKKFFDDVRVRKAMAYAIPVDEIIQVVAQGHAKRQTTMVSPLKKEYNKDLPLIPCDIEAAKKLLDEAGWKDTDGDNIRDKVVDGVKLDLRIEFKHQGGQKFVEDVAAMIKESAYKAGIDLVVVPVEYRALREQLAKHDFDMFMSALAGGALPEDYTQLWHTSAYSSGGSNYVGFGNAASDALLDSIKYTIDEATRIPMVMRLQKLVYDEQPYIFLYSTARKNIIHKRFGNQIMTFDKPGVILNNLRLLSLYGPAPGVTRKEDNIK